jgi:hypothetical protein
MDTLTTTLYERLLTLALILSPRTPLPPDLPTPLENQNELKQRMTSEHLPLARRLRDEVILPRKQHIGSTAMMNVNRLIPYYKYLPRFQLLSLIKRGFTACRRSFTNTEYFKDQQKRHGTLHATYKVARYYHLYRSATTEGLKFDVTTRLNLPIVFCAENICFRLDGTHRSSVARFLGKKEVPVVVVVPDDIRHIAISDELRNFVETLAPPAPGTFTLI